MHNDAEITIHLSWKQAVFQGEMSLEGQAALKISYLCHSLDAY